VQLLLAAAQLGADPRSAAGGPQLAQHRGDDLERVRASAQQRDDLRGA
jgi:hypothetical protein